MTQQQVNWNLGRANIEIAKRNADIAKMNALSNEKQAEASMRQANVASKRQSFDESTYGTNYWTNVAATGLGALIAWLI